ncbi:MAG: hypothetical protein R6U98_27780 [Pirellulaceae bacterium]
MTNSYKRAHAAPAGVRFKVFEFSDESTLPPESLLTILDVSMRAVSDAKRRNGQRNGQTP